MNVTSALREIQIENEAAMQAEARALAAQLQRGDCLQLEGTLGMGKTSFARALIQTLSGAAIEVASPTFTLVQSYPVTLACGERVELSHADLYRLETPDALEELGLHELSARGVLCVEWPAIAEGWLPRNALTLSITLGAHAHARVLRYESKSADHWATRLDAMG